LTASVLIVALNASVKAAPEDVRIVSYSWYTSPITSSDPGEFIVVGEIQNIGSTILDYVVLAGTAYTANGPQAQWATHAFVENMLPQQKAPFYMIFNNESAFGGNMTWDTAVTNVQLIVGYANVSNVQPFSGLQITNTKSFPDPNNNGIYTVTGTITNTGDQSTPGSVWVVATFYNASGTVVAVNPTVIPDNPGSLAPGDTTNFTATPLDYSLLTSQITSYSLFVHSQGTPQTATPTPSSSQPTFSPGTSQSPQTGQNSSIPLTDLVLVAAIVAVVIIVVAILLFIYKSQKLKANAATNKIVQTG